MFSDITRAALEKEVIGQPRAVRNVVRGVTRVASGLTPRERTLCTYLFMGPSGTGKTHLVQSLSELLHGEDRRIVTVDCGSFLQGDPIGSFVTQIAPLFVPGTDQQRSVAATLPLSIILVEYLERGPEEIIKILASVLESGRVTLPDGNPGILSNCIVIITSGLCGDEIMNDASRIGFTGSFRDEEEEEEEEQTELYKDCREEAENRFGRKLVGQLDGFVIFHRLEKEQLSKILDRRIARLNKWLSGRGFRLEVMPTAKEFLLTRGCRDLRMGARHLVLAHRRYVEFPVADLIISGGISQGGLVRVDCKAEDRHLHFTVESPKLGPLVQEVAVA